jgi:hypothetical protein
MKTKAEITNESKWARQAYCEALEKELRILKLPLSDDEEMFIAWQNAHIISAENWAEWIKIKNAP